MGQENGLWWLFSPLRDKCWTSNLPFVWLQQSRQNRNRNRLYEPVIRNRCGLEVKHSIFHGVSCGHSAIQVHAACRGSASLQLIYAPPLSPPSPVNLTGHGMT